MSCSSHYQALGTPITTKAAEILPKSDKIGAATVAATIDAFAQKRKAASATPPAMVGRATVKAIIEAFTPKKKT